jgi:dipeptidyl aminopeptidase/acylaminoacyl peptidase
LTRPLRLDDLPRFAAVSDPRISPDGQRIAYVVTTIDLDANATRSAVWLVPFEGGEPRRLTVGDRHDRAPRWSPDGRHLAFVSDRAGAAELYLLPLEGGEPRRLTSGAGKIGDVAWSPDSRRVAYVALPAADEKDRRRRLLRVTEHRHKRDGEGFFGSTRRHIWVVDAAGGAPAQLTDGPWDDGAPAWSPDGREIAFISDRAPDRDHHFEGGALHVVDVPVSTYASPQSDKSVKSVENGRPAARRLTAEHGRARAPAWSPDGRWLAYVGSPTADDASASDALLWRVAREGGEPECLSAGFGRSVGQRPGGYLTPSPPAWSDDGGLLYLANTGGATHLWRFGESRAQLTTGQHAALELSADRAGRRCTLLVTDPALPGEVFGWDAGGGLRQLTYTNAELLAELELSRPERLLLAPSDTSDTPGRTPPAAAAGATDLVSDTPDTPDTFPGVTPPIEGWLLRPLGAPDGPLPLVLSVHGGPHNFFGDTWSFDHQLYAALGWAVLYVNPRGSGGYGEAFASEVIEDWGGRDFQDLQRFLDHAIARAAPPIDPRRLAITGNSYGGYMTCWAVTQTDRFAVGVAGACISNLASFFGTSDIGASWGVREMGGEPWAREQLYRERSPITWVERVQTPLLLYHGEDDLRCPIEQSEQVFSALNRRGREVELLRIPGESHGALGSGSPVHRVEARRVILEWLRRYLAPTPP